MVTERMASGDDFACWFGEYATAPKSQEIDWRPEQPLELDELRSLVSAGIPLIRNPASRFAFVRRGEGALMLFVDGRSHDCSGPVAVFAEGLCAADSIVVGPDLLDSAEGASLLMRLLGEGSVAFDPDD